jgi:flagellar assembly protein FliH
MKPAPDILSFSSPLRDVRLVRCGSRDELLGQDLQASFERGRLEGERALAQQLVQQRAELMELQTGVLASLRAAVVQVVRDCERALVTLAFEAAQKLVAGLPVTPELIEAIVQEACAEVEDGSEFTVQVHPEDLALLEQINSPLLLPHGGPDRVRFQASPQVTRGGCLVQTRFGVIDARRETKANALRQLLSA